MWCQFLSFGSVWRARRTAPSAPHRSHHGPRQGRDRLTAASVRILQRVSAVILALQIRAMKGKKGKGKIKGDMVCGRAGIC